MRRSKGTGPLPPDLSNFMQIWLNHKRTWFEMCILGGCLRLSAAPFLQGLRIGHGWVLWSRDVRACSTWQGKDFSYNAVSCWYLTCQTRVMKSNMSLMWTPSILCRISMILLRGLHQRLKKYWIGSRLTGMQMKIFWGLGWWSQCPLSCVLLQSWG